LHLARRRTCTRPVAKFSSKLGFVNDRQRVDGLDLDYQLAVDEYVS